MTHLLKNVILVFMSTTLPKNSVINTRNFKKITNLLNSFKYGGNCWGTTLFLLGQQKGINAVESFEMDDFLKRNTKAIKKPRIGDILVLRYKTKSIAKRVEDESYYDCLDANLLSHTALYIGNGKYLHQAGYCGPIRKDSLKGVLNIYDECKVEYARFTPKTKKNTKSKKAKGKKK